MTKTFWRVLSVHSVGVFCCILSADFSIKHFDECWWCRRRYWRHRFVSVTAFGSPWSPCIRKSTAAVHRYSLLECLSKISDNVDCRFTVWPDITKHAFICLSSWFVTDSLLKMCHVRRSHSCTKVGSSLTVQFYSAVIITCVQHWAFQSRVKSRSLYRFRIKRMPRRRLRWQRRPLTTPSAANQSDLRAILGIAYRCHWFEFDRFQA